MNAIVVSASYRKYQNGAAINKLTDQWKGIGCVLGGGGGGWVDSESVDV